MSNSSTVVKKNFFWSSILTVSSYLFPLITYPYVSRVLGVAGIGKFQFASSIISYFSIAAMMGIVTIGIREIARAKGEKCELSQVFSSLVGLNLLSTIIAILGLAICLFIIPSFCEVKRMLVVGIAQILFNSLAVEWFYKGIEEFRYITIRGLLVRSIYVVCVFVFVRDKDDYEIYFILTAIATIFNALINIVHSKKYIDFVYKGICFRTYLKSFLTLGVYQILTAMYISFNVIYLGSKCGDVEVGYYTTATKLYGLIMSFFTAFTGVMLPRMSSLIEEKNNEEFVNLSSKSVDFLLLFSLPIIVISEVYAPVIINIISGAGYEGAILPMRIVMPLMLVIGYEQIVVIQMLSPLRMDNIILKNSIIGAVIALFLNLTIVSKYGSVGSAIVWSASELAVLLSAQRSIQKYFGFKMPLRKIVTSVFIALPAVCLCTFINQYIYNRIAQLLIGSLFVLVYFLVTELYVLKNSLLWNNMNLIYKRITNITRLLE